MKFIKKNYLNILIIIAPILIFTTSLNLFSIGVFEKYSIFTLDFKHQYLTFYTFLRENLFKNPSAFVYYQGLGFGNEMYGLLNYYLVSPLNFILFLFPVKKIQLAIYIILMSKYILGGLFFKKYISKYNLSNFYLALLTFSYMFSGYFVFNFINIIWLDLLYLLPLILMGIDKLIEKNRIIFFIAPMVLMIFCNFYIGYMMCLTSFIYLIYQIINKKIDNQTLNLKKIFINYFISAGLLVGTSMITLYTSYLSMVQSKGINTSNIFDDFFKQNFNLFEFISKLSIGNSNGNQIAIGQPNIWIPSIMFLILSISFILPVFSYKKKIFNSIILLFIYLLYSTNGLNLIFHGFSNPVWYLFRNSFIFLIFMLLFITEFLSKYNKNLLELNRKEKLLLLLVMSSLNIIFIYTLGFNFKTGITLIFYTLTYTLVIIKFKYKNIFLSFLFIVELIFNTGIFMFNLYTLDVISPQKSFTEFDSAISSIYTKLKNQTDIDNYSYSKNLRNTYVSNLTSAGVSNTEAFSSNLNTNPDSTLRYLGTDSNSNSLRQDSSTVVTDSILGIKYYILTNEQDLSNEKSKLNKNPMLSFKKYNFYDRYLVNTKYDVYKTSTKLFTTQYLSLYENKNTLSKFYLSNGDKNTDISYKYTYFENQDKLLSNILDKKNTNIFKKLEYTVDYKNSKNIESLTLDKSKSGNYGKTKNIESLTLDKSKSGNYGKTKYNIKIKENSKYAKLVITIDSDVENQLIYFQSYLKESNYTLENKSNINYYLNGKRFTATYINSAYLKKGTNYFTIEFNKYDKKLIKNLDYYTYFMFYSADVSKLNTLISDFNETQSVQTDTLNNTTKINLTILKNTENYKTIRSSIPYDSNWTAYLNGKKLETKNIDGYLAIKNNSFSKGDKINLVYKIPHIYLVIIISIISGILTVMLDIYLKNKKTS